MYSHHPHGGGGGGEGVGGHHTSRVLENLEKILNMYRQKCVDQNATIASLKDQVRLLSENSTIKTQKETHESREIPSSVYIQDLVDDFEVLRRENEALEAELRRVKKRLDIEEEWRSATLAWLESDWRVQKFVSDCLGDSSCADMPKGHADDDITKHASSSYRSSSLKNIAKKSRAFEKHMREKYSRHCHHH
ncbi:hypothetical protein M9435_000318 [Picochlorum sp. BPE23]|nr:hypothetical protein M9435_000318 [Picochlorum sp. BPE23]